MDKFDEYKFFSEDTTRLSERRQLTTQTYLTVNTAIFAIMAFLIKDIGFKEWELIGVSFPLVLVGILACVIWYRIIIQYSTLISWRFEQLRQMEECPEISACNQFYSKEWHEFYSPRAKKSRFGFSILEKQLPMLFLGLYIVTMIGVGIISFLQTQTP